MTTKEKAIEILSRPFDMKNVPQDILDAHRMAIEALKAQPDADYKTLLIKLENAEDVIRGLKEDLRDAREELRQRW